MKASTRALVLAAILTTTTAFAQLGAVNFNNRVMVGRRAYRKTQPSLHQRLSAP